MKRESKILAGKENRYTLHPEFNEKFKSKCKLFDYLTLCIPHQL